MYKITGLTPEQSQAAYATRAEVIACYGLQGAEDITPTATTLTLSSPAALDRFRTVLAKRRRANTRSTALASLERKLTKAVHKANTTCPPSIAKHLSFLA